MMLTYSDWLKIGHFGTLNVHMTLKNEVKVKFDSGFGTFGYMFGVVCYTFIWPRMSLSMSFPTCGHFL